jgi:transcriptional regulator
VFARALDAARADVSEVERRARRLSHGG